MKLWQRKTACVAASAVAAALAGCSTAVAAGTSPTRLATTIPTIKQLSHPSQDYWGLSMVGVPKDPSILTAENHFVHRAASVVNYFTNWTWGFDPTLATKAWSAGALPMVTWQPEGNAGTAYQAAYTLKQILSGRYDSYIKTYAETVKAYGKPIALRFAHEMNGSWYPWGVDTKHADNSAKEYVAVWRKVWKIFHSVGVHNVIWVWSVNAVPGSHVSLASVYPGASYVNWVGISDYLYTTGTTYAKAFNGTLAALQRVAPNKPWIVTETGVDGTKSPAAAEMTSLLNGVLNTKHMIGIVYFDEPGGRADWSFDRWPKTVDVLRSILPRKFHKAW